MAVVEEGLVLVDTEKVEADDEEEVKVGEATVEVEMVAEVKEAVVQEALMAARQGRLR